MRDLVRMRAVGSGLGLAALAMLLGGGAEAAPTSCPPLGVLPGFKATPGTLRDYDLVEFTETDPVSKENAPVTIAGWTCRITYQQEEGRDPMSNLEIQSNYRDQMQQLGATIVFEGGRESYAKLVKDGRETWLGAYSSETSIELTVVEKRDPVFRLSAPGPNDFRLVGHMPDFVGRKPEVRNFDEASMTVQNGDETVDTKVQGRVTRVYSALPDGAEPLANPDIQWNYQEAFRRLGAEILYVGGRLTTARLIDKGQVVWISAYASESSVEVTAVEEKPFEPSIKPPPTGSLKTSLEKTGRVTLYVNFDFGKATLRPEAAPVIADVLALLTGDPALKLGIEGHTDLIGRDEANQRLSEDRAKAIVAALVAKGVAPARLTPEGFGSTHPIATNDTSEGRAKNRRVELVKR